jgi:regulator of nucleoside diphosphate kinase
MFKRNRIITTSDRAHLLQTIRSPRNVLSWPHFTEALCQELDAAIVVEPHRVASDVVTMHSTVRLLDLSDQSRNLYTLVFPEEADLRAGRLSVLTTLGTALLGRRAGCIIGVPVTDGMRQILIEGILLQPEAARYAQACCVSRRQVRPGRYRTARATL